MAKPAGHTVLSFLGTQLDRGIGRDRWEHWRPNVAMCQHEDLLIRRLILLSERRYTKLFDQVAADIASVSPETAVERRDISLRDPWDFEEVFDALFSASKELAFDPEAEDLLVHMTTGTHVAQICLFLLTETRHFPARLLQTGPPPGNKDIVGTWQIIDLDLSRFDRLAQRFAQEHQQGESLLKSGIATRNRSFNDLITQMERVAPASTAPILLMGPTGAGKSQLARRIYELKKQRHQLVGPFVEVNCATIRGDAAHSTLFGHKRGAFTGALQDRAGLLRAADKGLLFLDEIGELGADEQAMLLQALEEKRFLPLGSDREVESDFQLIAGTNRDLGTAVARGGFREDLLARINLWTFRLPGLRDRIEDLEPNVDYELERFSAKVGRRVHFSAEARRAYLDFAMSGGGLWRGNFRDLNASITRLCTLAVAGRITEPDVAGEIERLDADWQRGGAAAAPGEVANAAQDDSLLDEVLGEARLAAIDRFDRVQLAEVVRTCRRHRSLSAAGRDLFAVSRERRATANDADRLRKYLARFGLEHATVVGSS
ncbi:MAG TPA: RNA repair transcriptional activator RtcR [Planctomycetota bacterium]|nr:RNA repair transcriptional activator RtcR [Planctomycetota bacterium]